METLYLLGEEHRIVGISGFTVRPPRARREKPRISAFTSAKIDRILELQPDLVLGFSDLQAEIARELVACGIEVHVFNQRTVAGILDMVVRLGALVGATHGASRLVASLERRLERIGDRGGPGAARPRVYFEEWFDPIISGIGWVSELVGIAGGDDVFPELAGRALGRERIVADPLEVVRRDPQIIVGSWCGRKFRPQSVAQRPGWDRVAAVRAGHVYEVKSALILQPGPAALTDGIDALAGIVDRWRAG